MRAHANTRIPSHTATAALAAAVAAIVSPLLQSVPADRDVQAVLDTSQPHPRDFVRIQQGTPFTVPAGRILVVTGMGFATSPGFASYTLAIEIDGVAVLTEYHWAHLGSSGAVNGPSLTTLPQGVVAAEAQVVTAASTLTDCVLLGYLADA